MNLLDHFYLIVQGRVGIFYPDHQALKQIQDPIHRLVYINEAEAKRRLLKRNKQEEERNRLKEVPKHS